MDPWLLYQVVGRIQLLTAVAVEILLAIGLPAVLTDPAAIERRQFLTS
jgi:hypothetical protein